MKLCDRCRYRARARSHPGAYCPGCVRLYGPPSISFWRSVLTSLRVMS